MAPIVYAGLAFICTTIEPICFQELRSGVEAVVGGSPTSTASYIKEQSRKLHGSRLEDGPITAPVSSGGRGVGVSAGEDTKGTQINTLTGLKVD